MHIVLCGAKKDAEILNIFVYFKCHIIIELG